MEPRGVQIGKERGRVMREGETCHKKSNAEDRGCQERGEGKRKCVRLVDVLYA